MDLDRQEDDTPRDTPVEDTEALAIADQILNYIVEKRHLAPPFISAEMRTAIGEMVREGIGATRSQAAHE